MDALHALRNKRDTRSYRPDPIDDEVLRRILDAARMAGSAKNRQPVRLIVVSDDEDKTALKSGGDFAVWIDNAPVVVVVTVEADAGPRRLFDAGRHCQNMMVAAHAEGLASCPVTVHHPHPVRSTLGIPETVEPVMYVTLGWPSEQARPSPVAGPRLPLDDYAADGVWPQVWNPGS
jgi:nitroreductase